MKYPRTEKMVIIVVSSIPGLQKTPQLEVQRRDEITGLRSVTLYKTNK